MYNFKQRTTIGVLVLIAVIGMAGITVGTVSGTTENPLSNGDHATGEDVNGTVIERTYVQIQSNEVYDFGPREDIDTLLPEGEYLEILTIRRGDSIEEIKRRVTVKEGTVTSAQSDDWQVSVLTDRESYEGSYESNSQVPIWAGVANDTAPKANVDVRITVRGPNRTKNTFDRTTDENGFVNLSYDLIDRPDGEYDVTVSMNASSTTGYTEFIAGPKTTEL